MSRKAEDLTGKVFGGSKIRRRVASKSQGPRWELECGCGNLFEMNGRRIRELSSSEDGKVSCRDCSTTDITSPEYRAWQYMKSRCYNKNRSSYGNYGGRGIYVCDRWIDDFQAFLSDMGKRPGEGYSLDRIDNELGYTPENCRWATVLEQANNKRSNIFVEFKGSTKTIKEWSKELDICEYTLYTRHSTGMRPPELFDPVEEIRTEFRGETKSLVKWADVTGIKIATLRARYSKGERGDQLFRDPTVKIHKDIILVDYAGKTITLSQAAKIHGLQYGTLLCRYRVGDRGHYLFRPSKRKPKPPSI